MKFKENNFLIQALEMLWGQIAPTMGRLGDPQIYQEMFKELHEQEDPLEYLRRAFELHRVDPPIEFEGLLGMAIMVTRDEPEKPELFRTRIREAQDNIRRLYDK